MTRKTKKFHPKLISTYGHIVLVMNRGTLGQGQAKDEACDNGDLHAEVEDD